ncbi:MAG: imidazole glycerol phosphate synthase subunit HisH [Clostridiales bacterium]|jgi:glutamine amidotransferase|nr:imidazole glycerol phosphate synthase subunit HisH [Clostridiales bacterium]
MIGIIDYGVGNLFSLKSSLDYLGLESVVTNEEAILRKTDRIILPGVGAFKDAYDKLDKIGLIPVLGEIIKDGKPLLGICLGMQLLFDKSYEHGECRGLGYINGDIIPMKRVVDEQLKIPHIGWNELKIADKSNPLIKYTKEGDFVYFVHSYMGSNCESSLVAYSEYGAKVPAIVSKDNIYGCQFHPEKSGEVGLKILRAFSEI